MQLKNKRLIAKKNARFDVCKNETRLFFICKTIRKEYFKVTRNECKQNSINRKMIAKCFKEEFEKI
jgi:hypothetical protein